MRKILRAAPVLLILCLISLIGLGFAYQATYESEENKILNNYVTINEGSSRSVIFEYTQEYDTETDDAGGVTFLMKVDTITDKIELNETPYELRLHDSSEDDNRYGLSAIASFPVLFEDSEKENACIFRFELRNGDDLLYYAEKGSGSTYTFVPASGSLSGVAEGTYDLYVCLVMSTESDLIDGEGPYIVVDKAEFADKFRNNDLSITFRAEALS